MSEVVRYMYVPPKPANPTREFLRWWWEGRRVMVRGQVVDCVPSFVIGKGSSFKLDGRLYKATAVNRKAQTVTIEEVANDGH